jgi:hypothetical protein
VRAALLLLGTLLVALGCGGVGLAGPATLADVEKCAELQLPAEAERLEFDVTWGIDCLTRVRFELPDLSQAQAFAELAGCEPRSVLDAKGRPIRQFAIPEPESSPAWWRVRPPLVEGVLACDTPYNGDDSRSLYLFPQPEGTVTVYFAHMDM